MKLWLGLFLLARVQGVSLAPELLPGDVLFAVRLGRPPRPGERVLAMFHGRLLVKDVSAVDGEDALLAAEPRLRVARSNIGARVVTSWRWRRAATT
ncbi:MAG: S24 family peptidase [Acidobacteriota bacterium]